MLLQPDGLHGGASGAVFGLMGMAAVGYQQRGINPLNTSIGTLLLLNLLITFVVPGISIGGHLGGAAAGALCALLVLSPRRPRIPARLVNSGVVVIALALGGDAPSAPRQRERAPRDPEPPRPRASTPLLSTWLAASSPSRPRVARPRRPRDRPRALERTRPR